MFFLHTYLCISIISIQCRFDDNAEDRDLSFRWDNWLHKLLLTLVKYNKYRLLFVSDFEFSSKDVNKKIDTFFIHNNHSLNPILQEVWEICSKLENSRKFSEFRENFYEL